MDTVSRDDYGATTAAYSRIEGGSTELLSSAGWNVLEQFWPDIRKALHPPGN
jgi:hypothetical protein